MFHFRATKELKELMDRTAEECGCSIQKLIRCCARSFNRISADVVKINKDESYYKSGEEVIAANGVEIDGNIDAFRQHIADRCKKALSAPQKPVFRTSLIEGVDYLVEKETI